MSNQINPAVITIEVLVLILNQDKKFKREIKEQRYESGESTLDDCIDECFEYFRSHGLITASTPYQRLEAARRFLVSEPKQKEFPDVRSCEVWLEYEDGSEFTVDTFLNMDLSIEEQIRETFETPNLEVEEGSKLVNFKWRELGI
jgi:hypothetical protein